MTLPDTREDTLSLAVPAGWKLVPIAPTPAQFDAGHKDRHCPPGHIYSAMLAAAPTPPAAEAPGQEPVADLDSRMIAAGMIPLSELLKGSPLDKWIAHSGLQTLDHFEEWLSWKRREYLQMRVAYELGDKDEKDELYEWVFAHAAVFGEVIVNYRAVKAQRLSAPPTYADAEAKGFEPVFRERPTHNVWRVGGAECLPCHCWADRDHTIGAEVKHYTAIRSLASPTPKGET